MASLASSTLATVKPFAWSDIAAEDWLPPGAVSALQAVEYKSEIWSGFAGDKLVAIFGYTILFPHVAEVWSYLHPDAARYKMTLAKTALATVNRLESLQRVQACALADHRTHCDFLVWLGFHLESAMAYAGPQGQTMNRYVWFPQEGQ